MILTDWVRRKLGQAEQRTTPEPPREEPPEPGPPSLLAQMFEEERARLRQERQAEPPPDARDRAEEEHRRQRESALNREIARACLVKGAWFPTEDSDVVPSAPPGDGGWWPSNWWPWR